MTDTSDLSVTVTADTDEFTEAINEATEAVEELEAALERLDDSPVSIAIETTDSEAAARRGLSDSLKNANLRR